MEKVVVILFLTFTWCSALWAGTIVDIQNKGELTSILTDGHLARLEMEGTEYAIVDYQKHKVAIVNPKKEQVTLLTIDDINPHNDANAVNIVIQKLGVGLDVSGFKTQKYRYSANGKTCGVIYGSHVAFETKGVKELFAAVNVLMKKQYAALGGFARLIDACTLADMQVGAYVNTFGVPMRTDKNGSVDSEIISIKADVSLPADTFVIPASYKTQTL